MLYTIENEYLQVVIDEVGGQLMSVKTKKDGHEYLWQGDPAYWTGRAYNLFPVIGRMNGGKYDYRGQTYDMPLHGLVRKVPLQAKQEGRAQVSFSYTDNEETRKYYPFRFVYKVTFSLQDNFLQVTTAVQNTDDKTIHFGVGGHPGFFVPMEEGLAFEDYYVQFERAKDLRQCVMTDSVLFTGMTPPYPLDGDKLWLKHSLFPVDALVLLHSGGKATIASDKGKRKVTMEYPDMKYMGVWQIPGKNAPYICLQPWSMLPASAAGRADFESKPDMTHLPVGETYENTWTLEIE